MMYTGITISNLDAIAYHLEQGIDNAGIKTDALALFLRSTARGIEASERTAAELRAQLATVAQNLDEYSKSCDGKISPNDGLETWSECVSRLAGELASRDEREHAPDIALVQQCAELRAQLATVTEQVSKLAALVRIKYGNLDRDVNSILDECGHGWKP